jgi:hypothetical protein
MTDEIRNPETKSLSEKARDMARGDFRFNSFSKLEGTNDGGQVKTDAVSTEIERVIRDGGSRGPDLTGDNDPSQNPFKAPIGGIPLE